MTLPRLLQAAGYRTIHVGKGHFGPREFEGADPRNLGFDVNVGGCSIGAPGSYYGKQNYGNGAQKRAGNAVPHLEKYHGTETFLTEALTHRGQGTRRASRARPSKPFFLYFAHYAVHAPFNSDPRFAAHYTDSGKPAPAQAFATLIEGMDKSLGDVLDHLDALGVAENTLIFFLGDNGSDAPLGHQHEVACAAPLRGKKGSHYEGGMRVPFIAAWAKANADNPHQKRLPIAAGAIQSQQAAVYDLFPTILALAGIEPPRRPRRRRRAARHAAGRQARPHAARRRFSCTTRTAPHRSDYFTCYRDGDWKVIYHYFPSEASENSHYQLFNLADDPFEQTNLAASQPDELRRMMQGLDRQHGKTQRALSRGPGGRQSRQSNRYCLDRRLPLTLQRRPTMIRPATRLNVLRSVSLGFAAHIAARIGCDRIPRCRNGQRPGAGNHRRPLPHHLQGRRDSEGRGYVCHPRRRLPRDRPPSLFRPARPTDPFDGRRR